MKKMIMVITMLVGMTAFGHHGWNHWVAGNILGGLAFGLGAGLTAPSTTTVVAQPVVTTTPVTTVYTTPAVTTTTIPTFSYGYYNNVYCPYYDGYYYYNNVWVWGGIGIRRPIPTWIPPYRPHYGYGPRVMPPRPAPHIAPRPMAPVHRGPVGRPGPIGGHPGGRPGGMPHGGPRR